MRSHEKIHLPRFICFRQNNRRQSDHFIQKNHFKYRPQNMPKNPKEASFFITKIHIQKMTTCIKSKKGNCIKKQNQNESVDKFKRLQCILKTSNFFEMPAYRRSQESNNSKKRSIKRHKEEFWDFESSSQQRRMVVIENEKRNKDNQEVPKSNKTSLESYPPKYMDKKNKD